MAGGEMGCALFPSSTQLPINATIMTETTMTFRSGTLTPAVV